MNALFAMELPVSEIIVERLGWVLVHSLWQFALVALLVGITMRAMRTSSAKMRHGVLIIALSLIVAAPVVTVFSLPAPASTAPSDNAVALQNGRESFAALEESSGPSQLSDVSSGKSGRESERPAVMPSRVSSSTHSRSQTGALTIQPPERAASWSDRAATLMRPWLAWIVAVWSFGVVTCSLRPLLGWHMLWRLKHVGVSPVSEEVLAAMRRVTTRLGVRYAVRVLQSTLAHVPVVVGYVRPVILLPVSLMTSLPTSQLEAILAHELAHVMRHDFVVNLLQTLVETLFFYHPAVWWMSHQLRIEREHCCDDLVVELLGNRVEYGRALVAVAELRGKNMLLTPGATDGSLLSRLRRIVGATRTDSQTAAVHQNNRWPVALACLLSVGLAAAVSTNWNVTASEKPEPPKDQVSSPFSDATAIAGQFLSAMTQRQLPYLDDLKLQALSKELHDSIVQLNANPISAERRAGLIKGVAEFVKREFNPAEKDNLYLEFRNRFDTLKWELRIALSRSEPTPTGMSQLMKQREWIRAEVAKLEEVPKFGRTHRSVVAQIETLFDDPLNPFFNEPMSESNFTQFQKQLLERVNRYPADRALIFAAPAVLQVAMDVLRDELLQKWPIRNVGYQRHDLRWSLNVTPQIGNSVLGLPDLHTHTSDVYLDVMKMIFVTDEAPEDLAARIDWLQKKQQGDLAFDAKSDTLVGVRGAKLAVLNASDWYTADQISLRELRDIVEKTGKDAIPLADFVEQDGDPAIGNRRVRTPSPSLAIKTNEGQFAVVRLWSMDTDGPLVKSRPRPLPPNPPLHPGDPQSGAGGVQKANRTGELVAARDIANAQKQIDAIADLFFTTLDTKGLDFVSGDQLVAMREELRDELADHITKSVDDRWLQRVLQAVDLYCNDVNYRRFKFPERFMTDFEILKWQLRTAMDRDELTKDELARRESQRQWFRDFVQTLPNPYGAKIGEWSTRVGGKRMATTLEFKLNELEEMMTDPLNPHFAWPLTDSEFKSAQSAVKNQSWLVKKADIAFAAGIVFHAVAEIQRRRVDNRWPVKEPAGSWDGFGKSLMRWDRLRAARPLSVFDSKPEEAGSSAPNSTREKESNSPPKEYGPKDWAGWFVNQVSYRKQKDGNYPAAAFKYLRKKVTEDLSDEPNAPGVDEARAWLDATSVDKNWGAADFEAMVERIGKWRLAIIQRALGAEEAASRSFPKPGRAATPEELKGLSFGPAAENGLRVAWVLDPAREEYKVGDDLKCRVVFHNSGTRPVQFAAWDVQDGTWTIRDGAGKALKTEDLPGSNVWTYPRVAAYQRYRLDPGQVVEMGGQGVGIGSGEHSAAKSQIPIWRIIHAQAGDSVRISVETKLDISVRFDEFPEEQARDWTGTLSSGDLKFRVVAAADANRQQPVVLKPKAPAIPVDKRQVEFRT